MVGQRLSRRPRRFGSPSYRVLTRDGTGAPALAPGAVAVGTGPVAMGTGAVLVFPS
jgi:hypothetical protein